MIIGLKVVPVEMITMNCLFEPVLKSWFYGGDKKDMNL